MNDIDIRTCLDFVTESINDFDSDKMWESFKYGIVELRDFDRMLFARLEQIYDILLEEISICTAPEDGDMSDCDYKTTSGKCAICQRGFKCDYIKYIQ